MALLVNGLAPRRYWKNGNAFSTGHYLLGKHPKMIDIDKLKIRAEMSISRENSFFAEYSATAESLDVQALFSLKHRQILLSKPSKAFDFVNDLQNRVLRAIARKQGARLFMVLHGDAELPPFDIHEVCPRTGEITRKAYIPENSKDAWVDAWRELNLL